MPYHSKAELPDQVKDNLPIKRHLTVLMMNIATQKIVRATPDGKKPPTKWPGVL